MDVVWRYRNTKPEAVDFVDGPAYIDDTKPEWLPQHKHPKSVPGRTLATTQTMIDSTFLVTDIG